MINLTPLDLCRSQWYWAHIHGVSTLRGAASERHPLWRWTSPQRMLLLWRMRKVFCWESPVSASCIGHRSCVLSIWTILRHWTCLERNTNKRSHWKWSIPIDRLGSRWLTKLESSGNWILYSTGIGLVHCIKKLKSCQTLALNVRWIHRCIAC